MRTSLITLTLSLTSAAIASPILGIRAAQWPYSIADLSLKHFIKSNSWHLNFTLTQRSPYSEALSSTTCHTTWLNGTTPFGPGKPEPCANTAYAFFSPLASTISRATDLLSPDLMVKLPLSLIMATNTSVDITRGMLVGLMLSVGRLMGVFYIY
ncbi:hypothetical protein BJX99DRAFT_227435 [Aspergillus californicus]